MSSRRLQEPEMLLKLMEMCLNEQIRKELTIIEGSESIARYRIGNPWAELDPAVERYIIGNRRLKALRQFLSHVTKLRAGLPEMFESQVPSQELRPCLTSVLVAGRELKFDCFKQFKKKVVEKLYSKSIVKQLANPELLDETINTGLHNTTITDQAFNEAVKAIGENNQLNPETVQARMRVTKEPQSERQSEAGRHLLQKSSNMSEPVPGQYHAISNIYLCDQMAPFAKDRWNELVAMVVDVFNDDD